MAFIPVYILILFITIVIDYFAGIWLEKYRDKPWNKWLLVISLITNIGFLAFFKYFNFINENLSFLLAGFGITNHIPFLTIALPIGLSFHTFQAMSYTIEVYRNHQKAEKNFILYALYVMFYPQLVAGPIERPQNILPQFHTEHPFDFEKFKSGLVLIFWGFFKKLVIADRLAIVVNDAYGNPAAQNGTTLLIATLFFAFQIYCDFSGYSDIAIGCARMMGIELMQNFNSPYFSASVSEFWSRWHISLSTWFRDYLYIPLGGNRVSPARRYFNLIFTFLISGLWHGANWTFVIWGFLHGIYSALGSVIRIKIPKIAGIAITFTLVVLAWVFFRANNASDAFLILAKIFTQPGTPVFVLNTTEMLFSGLLIVGLLTKEKLLPVIPSSNAFAFYTICIVLIALIYWFGIFSSNQFIYFQF
jgi:D-alanyl-lipoteichoic acid acyltransferase DltB (MBOAT superfamily)